MKKGDVADTILDIIKIILIIIIAYILFKALVPLISP